MELDLRLVLRIARRRGWIVVLVMVILGTAMYVRSDREPDQYMTNARVLLLGVEDSGSNYAAQIASQSLAATYRELIESQTIMQRVVDELDLPFSYRALNGKVSASAIEDTLLINIEVVDTEPERAALIADTTATVFMEFIAQNDQGSTLAAPVIIESSAWVPDAPFSPQPVLAAQIGAFVGLIIGIGIIILIEYLDNTVRPERSLRHLTRAPVLASIPVAGNLRPGGQQVFSLTQPREASAEAMRLVRTNLEFAAASQGIERIVVSSPGIGEGKSTFTANLAVVMAQGGMSVVIIDADLRRPTQHRIFGVGGVEGVTTLLTHPERDWREVSERVATPNLRLLASGPVPPNPSDLVNSDRFIALLDQIGQEVDLIIVDSPPLMSASDALSVAGHTDGVVLVFQSHRTRTEAVQHAVEAIEQGNIRLIGLVYNQVRNQRGATYYGKYYAPASEQEEVRTSQAKP